MLVEYTVGRSRHRSQINEMYKNFMFCIHIESIIGTSCVIIAGVWSLYQYESDYCGSKYTQLLLIFLIHCVCLKQDTC